MSKKKIPTASERKSFRCHYEIPSADDILGRLNPVYMSINYFIKVNLNISTFVQVSQMAFSHSAFGQHLQTFLALAVCCMPYSSQSFDQSAHRWR
jgi:hypothetical protein